MTETAEGHRDVVVAHVSKGQQLTAIDLDFGSRTTYSARNRERKRGKNWPVSQAMLSAHACFCIVNSESEK